MWLPDDPSCSSLPLQPGTHTHLPSSTANPHGLVAYAMLPMEVSFLFV